MSELEDISMLLEYLKLLLCNYIHHFEYQTCLKMHALYVSVMKITQKL